MPWSIADRHRAGRAWFCGLLLCAIAASIVIYMLVRGLQYVNLDAIGQHPVVQSTTTITGTERRLSRSDRGHPDPDRRWASLIALPIGVATAVWLSEYGRPAWLARAVESGVEIVAGTPDDRPGDLRAADLQQGHLRVPLLHRGGGRGLRSLLLHRGNHDVPDRAAADRRAQPGRRCSRFPPTFARRRMRSARTRSPRSAASCCRHRARASPPGRRWAWDGSRVTRRSS